MSMPFDLAYLAVLSQSCMAVHLHDVLICWRCVCELHENEMIRPLEEDLCIHPPTGDCKSD